MKKTILTILLLAFCVSISGAGITDQMRRVIAAKNAGAPPGACSEANDSELFGNVTYNADDLAADASHWSAQGFAPGVAITVTCLEFDLSDTPTYDAVTLTIELYDDNSGEPGNPIADTEKSIAETSIADGSFEEIKVCLDTPKDLSSGTYWIVTTGGAGDTSTNKFRYNSTSAGTGTYRAYSADGVFGGWSRETGQDMVFQIWGCNQ